MTVWTDRMVERRLMNYVVTEDYSFAQSVARKRDLDDRWWTFIHTSWANPLLNVTRGHLIMANREPVSSELAKVLGRGLKEGKFTVEREKV